MKEPTLFTKHLRAIEDAPDANFSDSAARSCETITKETAEGLLEWMGKNEFHKYGTGKNGIKWVSWNESTKIFYTTSELVNLYLSIAGETNQELKEKG